MEPAYIKAYASHMLQERIERALSILKSCTLCPHKCHTNRIEEQLGICCTGRYAKVSSYGPHFGEESPLVGTRGSGTIFFTHCNLLCVFCQNYDISHQGKGSRVTPSELAAIMMALQAKGVHNINLVTPSHVAAQILEALPSAIEQGLHIPLVYNSSGYDAVATLKLLEGIVDIYMPDLKFADAGIAARYTKAPDYPERAKDAVKQMYSQVGDLMISTNGIAYRGLLVRHLVMPSDYAGTGKLMKFLAQEVSQNTYVNVMNQYRPCGDAVNFKEISRPITPKEYHAAVQAAKSQGITRLNGRNQGLLW